jgi:hypothetical protein
MSKWMEAAWHTFREALQSTLHGVSKLREHARMHDEQDGGANHATFTLEEFRQAPSRVMLAVERAGRVVVTDQDGHPQMTLARQSEELTST